MNRKPLFFSVAAFLALAGLTAQAQQPRQVSCSAAS